MSAEAKETKTSPKSEAAGSPAAAAASPIDALGAADVVDDDGDSAISSLEESTASISSSIQQYRIINGRRYHSDRFDAQYWGSNDEPQNELLDIMHHFLLRLLDGSLFKAPIKPDEVQKVVDIGTGTGIWAIDFADTFPNASVIGTDISPIQPTWLPPNVEFQIDDCNQPWTFEPGSIDFIHLRWMTGTIVDWTDLFREAYKALKPGGYIQTVEPSAYIRCDDGTLPEDSALARWPDLFVDAGKKIGRTFRIVEDDVQRTSLAAAGFADIDVFAEKAPIGTWRGDPKYDEAGRYLQFALERDFEGMTMFVASLVGWSAEEVKVYVAKMRKELRTGKMHPYYLINYVWARKPLTTATATTVA